MLWESRLNDSHSKTECRADAPPKVYPAAIDQPMILSTDRLGDVFTRNEFS